MDYTQSQLADKLKEVLEKYKSTAKLSNGGQTLNINGVTINRGATSATGNLNRVR